MIIISQKAWFNPKNNRMYRCVAGKDLLGDWFVTRYWGSIDHRTGRELTCVYQDRESTLSAVRCLSDERQKRGYSQIKENDNER